MKDLIELIPIIPMLPILFIGAVCCYAAIFKPGIDESVFKNGKSDKVASHSADKSEEDKQK